MPLSELADIALDQMSASPLPVYRENLFTPDALRNPYGHYAAIRNLGPVVLLGDTGIHAVGRFEDVQRALRTPDVLISARGVGFNDIINAHVPEPTVIHSDGARHRILRNNLARPLMPAALKQHREALKGMITVQVREAIGIGRFDAIERLARYLPVAAISYLVGLPEDGRHNMLRWAAAQFDMQGPMTPALEQAVGVFRESRAYLQSFDPSQLREGSWAEALFTAVAEGRLTEGEARAAVSGYMLPSLDTTINSKGSLLYNLARNPDQWTLLKADPTLIASAVLENVRLSAVVRWFSRYAEEDYVQEGVSIPKGSRVMLMYASANRDERHYPDPDRYDVTRNPQDQLGWGTGPHMCIGMHLAKLEMEVLLEALVENVEEIEADEPVVGANNGLYGFESLPLRLN